MNILRKLNPFRYINGVRGTIALIMAVLLTPFLTVAVMLVESGRFNSAVSILDELLGSSAISTLANFDSYLHSRWGLLAVSQSTDIDSTYADYVERNRGAFGDSLDITSSSAEGIYPLSNDDILYNQIMEFSKLNSPTKLVENFSNITDLVKKLEKLGDVGKWFDTIGSCAGAIDSSITLAEAADDLIDAADDLDDLKDDYSSKYSAFASSVSAVASALSKPRPDPEKDEDGAKEYDDNIKKLRGKVDDAKRDYSNVLKDIIDALDTYKTKMSTCVTAIESIKSEVTSAAMSAMTLATQRESKENELKDIKGKITEMEKNGGNSSTPALYTQALEQRTALENELADIYLAEGVASAKQSSLSNASEKWKESFAEYSDAGLGEVISGFRTLKSRVDSFSSSSISSSTTIDPSTYHSVSIAGYIKSEDINAYLETQATDLNKSTLSALIDAFVSFFNSLLGVQLFFDPALDGYVDEGYYNENVGGLPGNGEDEAGILAIITNIKNMIVSAGEFGVNLLSLKWLKALKAAKTFLENVIDLGKNIVNFAIGIVKNIVGLFISYDRLYYTTYSTFNLACRTDFKGGTFGFRPIVGSASAEGFADRGIGVNALVIDDLAVLVTQITKALTGSGSDLNFAGAQLEYMLLGSNSEVANQLFVFVALYLVRLLFNLPLIFSDPEVQSLAAASTIGYPVVMILEVLVEPLIDTLLLVNGSKINLFKTTVYMTPSGLVSLLPQLSNTLFKGMSTSEKDALETKVAGAFKIAEDDYNYQQTLSKYNKPGKTSSLLEFDYREYCFMLMLLLVEEKTQLARLKNLILMETHTYYKNTTGLVFDLRKAYTYIDAKASADVKQILPSLADSSLFSVDRQLYRGY